MTTPKTCIDCSAPFKRSPADVTVRCPDCRKSTTPVAPNVAIFRPVVMCRCGKTVFVDSFGARTSSVACPQCHDEPPVA